MMLTRVRPYTRFHAVALMPFAVLCSLPMLGASCDSLASLSLPHTKITLAQEVTSGSLTPPGANNPMGNLPAFCRVAAERSDCRASLARKRRWN